jgi:hypothetical protein
LILDKHAGHDSNFGRLEKGRGKGRIRDH